MNHKGIETARILKALGAMLDNIETGFSPAQVALCAHYATALGVQSYVEPTAATMLWHTAATAYCAATLYNGGASFSHEADMATFESVARATMPEAFATEAVRILRGQAPDDGETTAIDPMVRIAAALECLALGRYRTMLSNGEAVDRGSVDFDAALESALAAVLANGQASA